MKRFLMLVGVAAIAAAMYVAASPASQQANGPTEKQFLALQKKVTALSKTLKTVKSEAGAAYGFLAMCFASTNAGALPVSEFGDSSQGSTVGYSFTNDGTTYFNTTALDIDPGTTPGGYLQIVDPTCIQSGGLRHATTRKGNGRLLPRIERGLTK